MHDLLFKTFLGDTRDLRAHLEAVLPEEVVRSLDWSTLRLVQTEVPTTSPGAMRADLAFLVESRTQRLLVLFVYEHQTRRDSNLALRFLVYGTHLAEALQRSEPGSPLPVIVPLLITHDEGVWAQGPQDVLGELAGLTPIEVRPFVVNLSRPPAGLFRHPAVGLAMDLLRRRTRLWDLFVERAADVRWILEHRGVLRFAVLMRYVFTQAREDPGPAVTEVIETMGQQAEEVFESYADRLVAKGRADGLHDGRRQAHTQMLTKWAALHQVDLPDLKAATSEQLEAWIERIFTGVPAGDVFAD